MMFTRRSVARFAVLVVAGGVLLQVGGCLAGLVPAIGSYAEAAALRGLLNWLIGL